MSILEIILTFIAGGGLTALINVFVNKKKAASEAKITSLEATKSAVELADQIAAKYNTTILDSMGAHEQRHDKLDTNINEIKTSMNDIVNYLNGGFKEYKRKTKTICNQSKEL